jgi:hypothetical protein
MSLRSRAPRACRPAQRGQSTVEFVVAALALLQLFIAVPLLGKYLDLFQTTETASRYVAFEGMHRHSANGWKTDAELGLEVRRRFFSNSDAPIKTGDAAGDFAAHRNPLWTDHRGQPLIAKFQDDVSVATTVSGKNAIAAATLFGGPLGLSQDNWYSAAVSVQMAETPLVPALGTTRRTVLLADAWTARNNAQIRQRIEDGGLPVYPIGKAKALVDLIGLIPSAVNDPALKVGDHDWDIVPCDRLKGGC